MNETALHPLAGVVARVHGDLDDGFELGLLTLGPAETGAAIVELERAANRLAALQSRLLAHAAAVRVEDTTGAPSTAVWFANATRVTRAEAHRRVRTAVATEERYDALAAAGTSGAVSPGQAEVIVRALGDLGDEVESAVRVDAERALVGFAAEHDAKDLRVLGRRILDIVAPAVGEAHEAELLAREERGAAAKVRLTMREDGHGCVHGKFTMPEMHGAMFAKMLDAIASPRRSHLRNDAAHGAADDTADDTVDARPAWERRGQAFVELIERMRDADLPDAAGAGATVVITMQVDTLTGGLAAASLDTGHRISPGEARRLACSADLVPAVLGTKSEVLDLGRTARLHSKPQRIAMMLRDGGCTADGCDAPPHWCEAHHDDPWSRGGRTSVERGRLLCWRHHRVAHDPTYLTETLGTGKLRFTRRN
ncbi:HNH endonuclease signature motif containing protein [Nocardioides sp. ChNu-99]|uniref:HNH endonuclease signature motif containing protein n=1 Tax=Nocardioides sp. ChNu-99 TaxID=2839897 RepID=UPI0024067630|nr:HNH endonuclease signature motif containing protein [Nocardioides sp. ChNu-99]MDF9718020.1 HNH endonuclease [Nocardioides sp. ChNu-99]